MEIEVQIETEMEIDQHSRAPRSRRVATRNHESWLLRISVESQPIDWRRRNHIYHP